MKQNSKTSMIKGRAYNQIQRYFQSSMIYNKTTGKFEPLDPLSKLSDAEKMEAIKTIMNETVIEMRNYKIDRKKKSKINQLRADRGWKPKKRTSKSEYEQMKTQELVKV